MLKKNQHAKHGEFFIRRAHEIIVTAKAVGPDLKFNNVLKVAAHKAMGEPVYLNVKGESITGFYHESAEASQ